jgi:minor extracellular protease Epr
LSVAVAVPLIGGGAGAQLLPPVPTDVGGVLGDVERRVTETIDGTVEPVRATARELARERISRLRDLVRAEPERLEMTDDGPAVRGEVIAIDPSEASMAAIRAAGFALVEEETIEGLDIRTATLVVPRGWSVDRALSRLRRIAPGTEFAANHLHLPSGGAAGATKGGAAIAQGAVSGPSAIGIVDGGVAAHPALRGPIRQRGFARGAPRPSAHGTAVASLVAGQRGVRGAAPGTPLFVADIYGSDPAGGNAAALVRALGWLAQARVPVVAVSLVGPANPLVSRAVEQARSRGMFIVAAVGNDGRAAPPAYPASYPGVIAVTGVDVRGRVLIEAGRALHIDYAAPGADMAAATANGGVSGVRGTSYAVPFVAGRLAYHVRGGRALAALDAEAEARGRRGVGRGIVCGGCRTPLRRD